ncbi:MAG: 1-acyl-sn-glycerol-3-phosphate acyltransferase [Odoribacter sp.]
MEDQHCIRPVHVEELFKSKNQRLARFIHGFVYSFLRRVIHEEEINEFIARYGDRRGLAFADGMLEFLKVSYRVEGLENLPAAGGRYIFASNHPLGGPDGVILISFLGTRYPDLKFPVNDLLLNLKNLNNVFLAVNKHGGLAKEAVAAIEQAYASSCQMIMFPSGMVSRKQHGVIEDLTWQKSFVAKAIQYERDIVPIFIEGKNSNFFYNLSNFRKVIHLKANLEMLYLPDETFRKRGETFTIHIGQPIGWQSLDKSRKPMEWAEEIRQQVYRMRNDGERSVR